MFLETIDPLAETDWKRSAGARSMLGCIVAGDAVRRRVEEQLELWDVEPRWVVPAAQAGGVINGYDHPTRLGADRWVALIGARWHVLARGAPRPALVVMVGTAVTVDSLDARPLPRRADPARLRPDAARARDGHRRPEGAHRRGRRFPDQHQRRADERRRACAIAGAIERMHRRLVRALRRASRCC